MPQVVNLKHPEKEKAQKNPLLEARLEGRGVSETEHSEELPDLISWEASEYIEFKKTSDWYWAVGIFTVAFFVISLIMKNILFGMFSLLAGFAIAMYGARPARIIKFSAAPEGIRIGDKLYPYGTLKSFWIFYDPPTIKEVSLESEKMIVPHIKVPLGETNPIKIREYLSQFIPEKRQEESLIDSLSRYLKF